MFNICVQVLEYTDSNMGYDAATGVFTDMIKAGIIDPLKVGYRGCIEGEGRTALLFTDTIKAGIVRVLNPKPSAPSPPQVVRTALVDAASVSSLITTSECVIAEAPEDKKASGGGGMPSPDMY